jgi:hypothetical protein
MGCKHDDGCSSEYRGYFPVSEYGIVENVEVNVVISYPPSRS